MIQIAGAILLAIAVAALFVRFWGQLNVLRSAPFIIGVGADVLSRPVAARSNAASDHRRRPSSFAAFAYWTHADKRFYIDRKDQIAAARYICWISCLRTNVA